MMTPVFRGAEARVAAGAGAGAEAALGAFAMGLGGAALAGALGRSVAAMATRRGRVSRRPPWSASGGRAAGSLGAGWGACTTAPVGPAPGTGLLPSRDDASPDLAPYRLGERLSTEALG